MRRLWRQPAALTARGRMAITLVALVSLVIAVEGGHVQDNLIALVRHTARCLEQPKRGYGAAAVLGRRSQKDEDADAATKAALLAALASAAAAAAGRALMSALHLLNAAAQRVAAAAQGNGFDGVRKVQADNENCNVQLECQGYKVEKRRFLMCAAFIANIVE
ncbi:hypothetical protein R5R35_001619 [Gryllus longicercus]|uniref:Accessory gland protein n=1 Tax=Gryllus longicercus TaxID=2509291 RepID=A0AAN9VQ88_9ORTH